MAVEVRIPTILRKHTGGEKAVPADGDTVRDLLGDLDRRYPGIAGSAAHRGRLPAPLRQRLRQRRGRPVPGRARRQAGRRRRGRDPPRGRGRGLDQGALRGPGRRHRQHPPGGAAAAVAPARRPPVGQAGGPQPDRQRQGPDRQGDGRRRREERGGWPRARPWSSRPAATPASPWPWWPGSGATGWWWSCPRTPRPSAASCWSCTGPRWSARRPPAAPTGPSPGPRSWPPSTPTG